MERHVPKTIENEKSELIHSLFQIKSIQKYDQEPFGREKRRVLLVTLPQCNRFDHVSSIRGNIIVRNRQNSMCFLSGKLWAKIHKTHNHLQLLSWESYICRGPAERTLTCCVFPC